MDYRLLLDWEAMLDKAHGGLPVRRQCELLGLSRSGVYRPRPAANDDEALARFGRPEIFNIDQGSQFTSAAFTGALTGAGVRISMNGRGRWMDNVFIERLWRSLKHEEVYLKDYADGHEARAGIRVWIAFYNTIRPHQGLNNRTLLAVWRDGVTGEISGNAADMTLRSSSADFDDAVALPTCP